MNIDEYKKRRSIWLVMIDTLVALCTLCAVAAMVFIVAGGEVSPSVWWVPAFVILGAPFVFLGNILLLVYWILRWKWLGIVVQGAAVVFVVWNLGAFVQMRFWNTYDHQSQQQREQIKLISYNVHKFSAAGGDYIYGLQHIANFLEREDPDVICFQEFMPIYGDTTGLIASTFSRWPHFCAMYGSHDPSNVDGVVVFSKYPFDYLGAIDVQGATGGAMVLDVNVNGDTVRLYNLHLQSTSYNQVNNEQSLSTLFGTQNTQEREQAAIRTTRALRDGFRLRSLQADTLATVMANSPHSLLVAGDMNSAPLSYTYQKVRGDLMDAFRTAGEGYGYTYRPMKGLFRIDFAFYDPKRYECVGYESPYLEYSDHNPIVVNLKKKI